MPGLEWAIYAFALVVLLLGALASSGRFEGMPPVVTDVPRPATPGGPVTSDELRRVRLAVVPRGYSMGQVDALLERVALQLEQTERAELRGRAGADADDAAAAHHDRPGRSPASRRGAG